MKLDETRWKTMKSMKNDETQWKNNETQWNAMKKQWNSMKNNETQWKSMKLDETQWKNDEKQWNSMKLHGKLRNLKTEDIGKALETARETSNMASRKRSREQNTCNWNGAKYSDIMWNNDGP